jgi:methylase of polypeptide subunit release factors
VTFTRPTRQQGRDRVATLVENFRSQHDEVTRPGGDYSEPSLRTDFLDPLLEALGWDVSNALGQTQGRREVKVERSIELVGGEHDEAARGKPDYELRADGKPRLFVEAKKPSLRIMESPAAARQARRYGFSGSLPAAVLTNFTDLVFYDTRTEPPAEAGVDWGRIPRLTFHWTEYHARFDELWEHLSWEVVASGRYFGTFGVEREFRGESAFDARFLAQIRAWRQLVAQDIADHNRAMGPDEVGDNAQRLLNALVFLRVCEDRSIEEYGSLQGSLPGGVGHRFVEADRRFNAGLFDVLANVSVGPSLLGEIVGELYHPRSIYSFAVVQPDILASIYEQYLGERVELDGSAVRLRPKPEVTHAEGVVPTPDYIVEALVTAALADRLEACASADELLALRVGDMACGSGTFLLAAYRRLLDRLEVLLGRIPTFQERRELLSQTVYGVDIDPQAVEVTRLSLQLGLLEDQSPEVLRTSGQPLLPDLASNVQAGNALIDGAFDEVLPGAASDPRVLAQVRPFDWRTQFPTVFRRKQAGFDAVVGNPPYIRIQALHEFAPQQHAFFTSLASGYRSSESYNFDAYQLFVERGLDLLNAHGLLALVVPHRFAVTTAGAPLRALLGAASGRHLRSIVHFGTHQVFPNRTTYVCLLVASKQPNATVNAEIVQDLPKWRAGERGRTEARPISDFGLGIWRFGRDELRTLHRRLEARFECRLGDLAHIFVGVQTSRDSVYFVKPVRVHDGLVHFRDAAGAERSIEEAITKPALLDRRLEQYDVSPLPERRILFPYTVTSAANGRPRACLIPLDRMTAEFPLALAYLEAFRGVLDQRSIPNRNQTNWYQFGRSQNLAHLADAKIIVRVLSTTPRYCWDPDGLVAAGGGSGPYYFIRIHPGIEVGPGTPLSHQYLIAVLSHPAIDGIVMETKQFRGGYAVHGKATLEGLPVPIPSEEQHGRIVQLVNQIHTTTLQLRSTVGTRNQVVLRERWQRDKQRIEQATSDVLALASEHRTLLALE